MARRPPQGLVPMALEPPATGAKPRMMRRMVSNRSLVAGLVIVGALVALAVLAPLVAPYDPQHQDLLHGLAPPSGAHLLGTDELGRDVFSRLIWAGRIDLLVGFTAVLIPFILGMVLGTVSGYFGGLVDTAVMRVVDVVIAFPFYVLVITLVFVVGVGIRGIYIALAITDWVSYARITRSSTMVVRELDWVTAARSGGLSTRRILVRHVLPNTISQAVVYLMSDIVFVIVAVVTLGYLGLGVQPPTPDWGTMISDGQAFITTSWWLSTAPGLAVVLAGLGLSLVGDGLSDVLRPQ